MWTFRCYIAGANEGIHGWYDSLPPSIQGAIDAVLLVLATERALTDSKNYEVLRGSCEGLAEVIVDVQKTREERNGGDNKFCYRLIGFEGPGKREFTLLYGFVKDKDNSAYGPACRSAHKRKEGAMKDDSRTEECAFPGIAAG